MPATNALRGIQLTEQYFLIGEYLVGELGRHSDGVDSNPAANLVGIPGGGIFLE